MGTYLSTPVKEKNQEEGICLQGEIPAAWGVVDMQGWRKTMEDAHVARSLDNGQSRCFGVFDGHGGAEVARFCALYLVSVWKEQQQEGGGGDIDCGAALRRSFHALDRLIDDPARHEELVRLRAIAPAPGEQRSLDDHPKKKNDTDAATAGENGGSGGEDDDRPPQTMFSPPPPHSITPPPRSKDKDDVVVETPNKIDCEDDCDVEFADASTTLEMPACCNICLTRWPES